MADSSIEQQEAPLPAPSRLQMKHCLIHRYCSHSTSTFCQLQALLPSDITKLNNKFNSYPTVLLQDNYLKSFIQITTSKRKKEFNTIHFLVSNRYKEIKRLCKMTFCAIFGLGRKRVERIVQKMKAGNNELLSNRGGDRTTASSLHLSTEIVDFIKEFRVEDSHYGRTNVREGTVFLQPELTITKLHSLFEERYPEKEVKYWRFYGAFRKYETFKFKKPNVDMCIKCDRLQNTIRNTTSTAQAEAKKELTMHQKNAKEFYDLIVKLKNEKKEVICFDLQKQLPIPKHNSSQTYYLPKIWLYNLGFVNHPTPREDNCSII